MSGTLPDGLRRFTSVLTLSLIVLTSSLFMWYSPICSCNEKGFAQDDKFVEVPPIMPPATYSDVAFSLPASSIPPYSTTKLPELVCGSEKYRQNVAVCISGQARSMTYPVVFKSIKEHVIDSLSANSKVFAYLKLKEEEPHPESVEQGRPKFPHSVPRDQVQAILRYWGANDSKLEEEVIYHKPNPNCTLEGHFTRPSYLARVLGQFSSLKECYQLVLKHEQRYGYKFDWIARVRPDAAFFHGLMPSCLYDPEFLFLPKAPVWPDHFNLVPRKYSDVFFSGLIDSYYSCMNETMPGANAELYMDKLMNKAQVHVRITLVNF